MEPAARETRKSTQSPGDHEGALANYRRCFGLPAGRGSPRSCAAGGEHDRAAAERTRRSAPTQGFHAQRHRDPAADPAARRAGRSPATAAVQDCGGTARISEDESVDRAIDAGAQALASDRNKRSATRSRNIARGTKRSNRPGSSSPGTGIAAAGAKSNPDFVRPSACGIGNRADVALDHRGPCARRCRGLVLFQAETSRALRRGRGYEHFRLAGASRTAARRRGAEACS